MQEAENDIVAVSSCRIIPGREYEYICGLPVGCKGGRYRVDSFALLVPAYQEVVIVDCIAGKDKGLRIACSLANFAQRYRLVKP